MGYREIIPPERLQEFEEIGENEVQAKLDAGLYGGRRKDHAILFIKLCESEHEVPTVPWHELWWGKAILAVTIAIVIAAVLSRFGFG